MNSKEQKLHGFIASTERMSGFDSAEGDMSYFDDDNFSYLEDESGAAGAGPSQLSDPYVIQYQNTDTANDATCVLFGYNDNFGATNGGNQADIVITNLQGGTYGRLLAQSNNKNFKIGKFRFQSSTAAQLQQTLTIYHVDANGKQYSVPLNLSIEKDSRSNSGNYNVPCGYRVQQSRT